MGFCVEYKKPKNWHFFIPVYSSALSSSGDIEYSSGCLKGDKCERVKANIRKKYYLISVNMFTDHSSGIFLMLSQYIEKDEDNKPWCNGTFH